MFLKVLLMLLFIGLAHCFAYEFVSNIAVSTKSSWIRLLYGIIVALVSIVVFILGYIVCLSTGEHQSTAIVLFSGFYIISFLLGIVTSIKRLK